MESVKKRRPRTPKTITCECGKEAFKVQYALYECSCSKAYFIKDGIVSKGKWYIKNYNYGGFKKEKPRICYDFPDISFGIEKIMYGYQ